MNRLLTWAQKYCTLRTLGMLLAGGAAWLAGFPVAFGMADEVTTTVLTNDQATEWISKQTLRVALRKMACYQFAFKHILPAGEGRTFQIPRYELLVLPKQPAAQGTTPANTPMVLNKVTATAEQWVAVITIPDVAVLTTSHPVLQLAIDLAGIQAGMTYERETQRVLMAGTNVQFANGRANRTAIVSGDVLTSLEVRKAVGNLDKGGASPMSRTTRNTTKAYISKLMSGGGGIEPAKVPLNASQYEGYMGIVDQDMALDLQSDSTFVNAASYSGIRALYEGEAGKWLGVYWVKSNFFPSITLLTSPTIAGANMTGFAGGLSASTVYDVVVTRAANSYGIEEVISATISTNTGSGNDSLSIVLPASSGNHYRIYAGASGGTMYEVQTASTALTVAADDITGPAFEPNQTLYLTAIPTSGRAAPIQPASGVTVHLAFVFGLDAYGCVDLDALKSYLTKAESTDSDPAVQRRKVSWKAMYKAVIQNNNFLRVIEATSAFAS